jgi:hypothetical protein
MGVPKNSATMAADQRQSRVDLERIEDERQGGREGAA